MLGTLLKTLWIICFNPHSNGRVFIADTSMLVMEKLRRRATRSLLNYAASRPGRGGASPASTLSPTLSVRLSQNSCSFPTQTPPANLSASCSAAPVFLLHKQTLLHVFTKYKIYGVPRPLRRWMKMGFLSWGQAET